MAKNQHFLYRVKVALFVLKSAFKEEKNFRIQCVIALAVMCLMVFFRLDALETSVLLLTMLVVLISELVNSQIEKFLDLIEPNHHPRVKIIKDFSAGAVLLSVVGSIIIGLLIFLPRLMYFIK